MLGVVAGLLALAVPAAASAASGVAPNATNNLDCNGWSASYQSARPAMKELCTDPIAVLNGKATRFIDNGWYVGHDEPSVKFISTQPGSANQMTYFMKLPVDPKRTPTVSGKVTDYAELSPAPWFGLPICDPHSYPQKPCTPDSDTNSGLISDPNAAGSAFLELQFYPPGFTPFIDSASCSPTQWCSALNIDSLECTFNFATCNNNCIEPVNFAYIQHDGNPAGPPSPQLTDVSTFTPNRDTLMMNGGDVIEVSLSDPPQGQGLTAVVKDLTTGETGLMVASAANGFMNTNIADCSGTPFTFHAEYSSAQQQNQVPWAALEGGVLMEQEIGHFETCNSVTNQDGFSASYANGQSFLDPFVFQTCVGGTEGSSAIGEGPCDPSTGVCTNSTTEGTNGPVSCPSNNFASVALCEYSDGNCMPAGSRPVVINGTPGEETWPIAGCQENQFENGDLDFDGTDYQSISWPNGTPNHPTPASYIGPFTGASPSPYPTIQFETDVAGSESLCNLATGENCVAPPVGASFYPYWSLSDAKRAQVFPAPKGQCVWNIGKTIPGLTSQDFGGPAEYGTANLARYAGTVISAPMANPEFNGNCGNKKS
jgi:hypothetical protein